MALVGPTASGKSAVAMAVATILGDAEIVSADSMQVYRGMDVGTAKPTAAERAAVPHHVIDVADPDEEYSVSRYQADACRALADIAGRGAPALVVGGTGLYVRAVVDRLDIPGRWPEIRAELEEQASRCGPGALHRRLSEVDPVAASRMLPGNHRRVVRALEVCLGSGRRFSEFGPGLARYPGTDWRLVGLEVPRDVLGDRIEARYHQQMKAGLLDEVERLARCPGGLSRTASQALGYRELLDHLRGRTGLEEALALAVARTRSFARRQMSWFRRDPRIRWVAGDAETVAVAAAVLGDWN